MSLPAPSSLNTANPIIGHPPSSVGELQFSINEVKVELILVGAAMLEGEMQANVLNSVDRAPSPL